MRSLLETELGHSGMWRVLEAWDPVPKRVVALRLLHGNDPGTLLRFRRKAQALGQAGHPHICRILGIGRAEAVP